jgi:hypothetical protein
LNQPLKFAEYKFESTTNITSNSSFRNVVKYNGEHLEQIEQSVELVTRKGNGDTPFQR